MQASDLDKDKQSPSTSASSSKKGSSPSDAVVQSNPASNPTTRLQVDREKICPMLVRLFCREGGHHKIEDFYYSSTLPIDDELIIYTWKDATLKELSNLIQEIDIECRQKDVQFVFRILNHERFGQIRVRDLGKVYNNPTKKSFTPLEPPRADLRFVCDEDRNLDDARFIAGDFVDVAIIFPRSMSAYNNSRSFSSFSSVGSHPHYNSSNPMNMPRKRLNPSNQYFRSNGHQEQQSHYPKSYTDSNIHHKEASNYGRRISRDYSQSKSKNEPRDPKTSGRSLEHGGSPHSKRPVSENKDSKKPSREF